MDKKYAGFISYRHVSPDQEIAEALHDMLEHNRVRPNRTYPNAIRPVFMDRKELPLMADLDEGIIEALEQSDCLFVICSPNLPKSKYCMREIAYFKQLHNGSTDRIFTLLVGGTPETSFPEILRTKTKFVTDCDGTIRREQVEAEPLFADIRGTNLKESLRKLRRTEYLRLAAGYYQCSYDALYKRRTRWIASVIAEAMAAAMVLGACFGWYAYRRNEQYNTAKANTYASYAEKQTQEQNEILALTLCDYAQPAASDRMDMALRNAVVQIDYRRCVKPISKIFQVSYADTGSTVFYLNDAQNQILIIDRDNCKIIDVETGTVTLETAVEKLFVDHRNLDHYLLLESHPDDNKIMQDYVVLYDLNTNEKISEFPFREADRYTTSYKLVTAAETDQLLMVTDGYNPVAFLTRDGQQLTEEEFIEMARQFMEQAGHENIVPERMPLQVVKKRTLLGEESVIMDETGNVVLELGKNIGFGVFSADWDYFACEKEGELLVYNLGTGRIVNRLEIEKEGLGGIYMLHDSTYLLHSYWNGNAVTTVATDWVTGKDLAVFPGKPLLSTGAYAFFTVESGAMTRYEYAPMDLRVTADVVAQTAARTLALNNNTVYLYNAIGNEQLLETVSRKAEDIRWAADLSHLLIPAEDGVSCFDGNGQLLWTESRAAGEIAISEDGILSAWMDDAYNVHIVDSKTGMEQRIVTIGKGPSTGEDPDIALSGEGLCIRNADGVWWQPETGDSVSLGDYSAAAVYTDGLVILSDEDARVLDFQIFDSVSGNVIYQPEDNTGSWIYHSGSGYLIRQVQTSGNHTTNRLEVRQKHHGQMQQIGEILLAENRIVDLMLDCTGKWLTIHMDDRTMVYRLQDMHLYLDAICTVNYEDGTFWGDEIQGGKQYSITLDNREDMLAYAQDLLTGSLGKRSLTEYEKKQYSFSDKK